MVYGPASPLPPPGVLHRGPPDRNLVCSWPVPSRAGARLDLWYVAEDDCMILTITDGPACSAVARLADGELRFCSRSGWVLPSDSEPGRALGEPGMLAMNALRSSGTFCGFQATVDFQEVSSDPVWADAVRAARDSLDAAAVMAS